MSDDINGIGGEEIWRPDVINWRSSPTHDFDFARTVLEFPGSSHQVIQLKEETPQRFGFLVSMFSKEKEYNLLDKFLSFGGRFKRFWLLSPLNLFTLAGVYGSGVNLLTVLYNNFDFRGFERIAIVMKGGDLLTHEISSVDVDVDANEIDLNLDTSTDRALSDSDIKRFTLLHLMRLDIDSLEITHLSAKASECNLKFVELVQEYAEI